MTATGTVFSLAPAASFESVGGGAVVLLADSGQLYSCNETSEAFLRHIDGVRSISVIAGLMIEEFEVAVNDLEADLCELAEDLKSEGILTSNK